jgi:hypothetical protein
VTAGAQVTVQVAGADLENVVVTIGAGVPVNGLLVIEGNTNGTISDRLRIQLVPSRNGAIVSFVQAPGAVGANENGTFTLENVLPGEYRVQVVGLQPDLYIKEARFGSRDVLNSPLLLSATASEKLEIVVSARGSRIQGTVTNQDSRPAAAVAAVLVPDEHRDRPDLFRNVTTDQNGRFVMTGVAPGNYKVFAWETLEPFVYYDPNFIKRYEPRGLVVNVVESFTPTVEVRLISGGQ